MKQNFSEETLINAIRQKFVHVLSCEKLFIFLDEANSLLEQSDIIDNSSSSRHFINKFKVLRRATQKLFKDLRVCFKRIFKQFRKIFICEFKTTKT